MVFPSKTSTSLHRWPRTRITFWNIVVHILLLLALALIMAKADTARPQALWVPTIVGTSTDTAAVIGCRSNISITFSTPLPPTVSAHRLIRCQQPHDITRSRDGRTLEIIPRDVWQTGVLMVTITASAITGDAGDDITCLAVIPATRGVRFRLRHLGSGNASAHEVFRRRTVSVEQSDTIILPDAIHGKLLIVHGILEGPACLQGQRVVAQASCDLGDIVVDAELREIPPFHAQPDTTQADTVAGAMQKTDGDDSPTTDTTINGTAALPPSILFTLKGAVASADGGDVPPDAVTFPDGTLFTGQSANLQEFRVKASDCWIITAVTTERGTEHFEPGIPSLIIREHMRAPMHTVVIAVSRRWVTFTVTRHLLAQAQGNGSVLPYPPCHQAAVRLERRMETAGGFLWTALDASACGPDDRPRALTWRLRCGDDIRLVIEESRHRGLWLRSLDDGENIVSCSGSTVWTGRVQARRHRNECRQNADDAHVVNVFWYQDMRVVRVGMSVRTMDGNRSTSIFRRRWYELADLHHTAEDEPPGGRQIEYEPGLGATIDVEYSHPFDSQTLDGCLVARSFNGYHPKGELWARDVEIVARPDARLSLGQSIGGEQRILRFAVHDPQTTPRRQCLPMSTIILSTQPGLRSMVGEPCVLQHVVLDRMEYPAALLRVNVLPTEHRKEHVVTGERRGLDATERRTDRTLVTTATEEATTDAVFEYAWLDRADELVVDVTTDGEGNHIVVHVDAFRRQQRHNYVAPSPWVLTLRPLLRRAILE